MWIFQYLCHFDILQKAFEAERTELLENNHRKWETAMGGRRDQELDYMKQREKRVEEYEQQLQHLRIQDAEEYNMVKIKLETDVQVCWCIILLRQHSFIRESIG